MTQAGLLCSRSPRERHSNRANGTNYDHLMDRSANSPRSARVWLAITELPCATKMAQRETIIQSRYMREKQQATRAHDTHASAGLAYVCLVVVQRNGQKEK